MSDSKIKCLLVMPYSHEKMMMEVSQSQNVAEVMNILKEKYQSSQAPQYFYHYEKKYVLDNTLSFGKAGVRNGDILYWI